MPQFRAILLVLFTLAGVAGTAHGQSYATGYAKYQRGDFKAAERALTAALKTETTPEIRAKTYKLLGICQYMRSDKTAAAASFREGLALSPTLAINSGEVIDDSVLDFFQQLKPAPVANAAPQPDTMAASGAVPAAAEPTTAAPPPRASAKTTAATADDEAPAAAHAATTKTGTKTGIRVQSNVADANVLLDGIIAGQVGTLIQVAPGQIEIEVQALGYPSKKRQLSVAKGQETDVTVNLQKPKAKTKAKAKAKAEPDAALADADQPTKTRKKPKRAKRGDNDLFADRPATGGATPRPPPVDPAAEFEREAMESSTIQAYGQHPATASQGGYAQGSANDPYAPSTATYLPPDYRDQAAAPAAERSGGGGSALVALLPFGAGQFQNHEYLLGTVFLVGQAGALYEWYSQTAAASNAQTAATQVTAQDGGTPTGADVAYVQQLNAAQTKDRQMATYGLIGFGALWATSIAEALYVHYEHAKSPAKRRHYGGIDWRRPDEVGVEPVLPWACATPTGLSTSLSAPTGALHLAWDF